MGAPSSEQITLNEQLAIFQKQLDEKHLIIDTILKSTQAGYWDWNIKEKTEYLSPALKKMFGYEDDEINNHPDSWKKLVHPDDLPGIFECYSLHVQSEGIVPYSYSARFYHKNGSTVNIYCEGQIIDRDEAGKPVRMIGVYKDITELTQIKIKLAQRNAELEDFVYATSHDLKEPVRTITSFIELLQQKNISPDKKQKYLDIVSSSSKRIALLIQGILEHSRIGKKMGKQPIGVSNIINDICRELQPLIIKTKAKITFDKDLPTIVAYPTELRMLFQNLLSNSLKFIKKNRAPKIDIQYNEDSYYHIFHIKDNGIGIDDNKHDKIFNLFARLNSVDDFEGIGIGLTHCKKIAELHEGSIHVKKNTKQGAVFSVYINKTL